MDTKTPPCDKNSMEVHRKGRDPYCRNKSTSAEKISRGNTSLVKKKVNGRDKILAIVFMVGTLFFWYYALNSMWFYIYTNPGFTRTGVLFGTIVSLSSGLVYAYLIYYMVKSDSFNLTRSVIILLVMIAFAVIIIFAFPIEP